jgi:hypothetical protein
MLKYEIDDAETGETVIHYDGADGYDMTLCGFPLEVDIHAAANEPRQTQKRVSCQRCLAIVRHVRGTTRNARTEQEP